MISKLGSFRNRDSRMENPSSSKKSLLSVHVLIVFTHTRLQRATYLVLVFLYSYETLGVEMVEMFNILLTFSLVMLHIFWIHTFYRSREGRR